MLAVALFRRGRRWEPPAPRCAFIVSCAGPLPTLEPVLRTGGGGTIEVEVCEPPPAVDRLPDRDFWPYVGLTEDLARRVVAAEHEVNVVLTSPGDSVAETVLAATKRAAALAEAADGCVSDVFAFRFFGPDTWRVEEPLGDFDVREHIILHTVPMEDDGRFWIHTHGLVKFGRPEFEIHDLSAGTEEGAAIALNDMGQYVALGALISPNETVGDQAVPLHTRVGERERDHWEDIPVLELVDVDERGHPAASGAERGLRAWWPEHFEAA
jgi:hypothetical protein